jgi:hypothetical protein
MRNATFAVTGLVLVASLAVRAHQGMGGGAPAGKPLVPLTASSLATHPELYIGEPVSVMATVEKSLSKTAFSIDQDPKSSAKDVLVIAPYLSAAPVANAYITVIGDAVKFDPADVARRLKDYKLDLAPDVIQKYLGKPAILATSVLTADMTDIGKKALPPITPAEQAFSDNVMKKMNATVASVRTSLDASDAAGAKTNAAALKKLFADTQAFFTSRGTIDAAMTAGEAVKFATTIETAAAAGKWDDAKAAANGITPLCAQCHGIHRERLDDGSFRVKSSK